MSKVDKYIRKNYFKIVIGGDGGVGKTAFSKRLTGKLREDDILEMTPGVDFHALKIKNNIVNLQFWDLGGQDQFRYFQKDFFGGATLVILIFAIDSYITFKSLNNWLGLLPDEMLKNVFLIGNKIDLSNRSVEIQVAMDYAEAHGMNYYEVSALTGVGINEVESDLINTIEKIYASRRKE